MQPEDQIKPEQELTLNGMKPKLFRQLIFRYLETVPNVHASFSCTSRFFRAVCGPELLQTFLRPRPTPFDVLQKSLELSKLRLVDDNVDDNKVLKIMLVGEPGNILQDVKQALEPSQLELRRPIGMDFVVIRVPFGEEELKLQVWDPSMKEMMTFRNSAMTYLKNSKIIYHCCDMQKPKAIATMKSALELTQTYRQENQDVVGMMIIKNRHLCSDAKFKSLQALADSHNIAAFHGFTDKPGEVVKAFNVGLRFWLDAQRQKVASEEIQPEKKGCSIC